MKYISPFTILNIDASQIVDKQVITLAKKKYLAEVELSATQTIVLSGMEMTKNDVLVWFEKFDKIDDLYFHQLIHQHQGLSDFLATQIYNPSQTSKLSSLSKDYHTSDFVYFISPYFSTAYQKKFLENLEKHQDKAMRHFLDEVPMLMTPSDINQIWFAARDYLAMISVKIRLILEKIGGNNYVDKNIYYNFISENLSKTINLLPYEEIGTEIDLYCRAIHDIAVTLWNTDHYFNRKEAKILLEHAMSINSSEFAQQKLRKTYDEIVGMFRSAQSETYASTSSEPREEESTFGTASYIAMFIVFLIIGLSNRSNDKVDIPSNKYRNFSPPPSIEYIERDDIIKEGSKNPKVSNYQKEFLKKHREALKKEIDQLMIDSSYQYDHISDNVGAYVTTRGKLLQLRKDLNMLDNTLKKVK
jgi:hypothetical protein